MNPEELHKLRPKLAALLGFKLHSGQFIDQPHNAWIEKDQVLIYISNSRDKRGQLHISAHFNDTFKEEELRSHGHHHFHLASIGVSEAKTPEQIARDMERRLLPELPAKLEALNSEYHTLTSDRARKLDSMREIADALEKPITYHYADLAKRNPRVETHHGEFRTQSDGEVEIKIAVSQELAYNIAGLLAGKCAATWPQ